MINWSVHTLTEKISSINKENLGLQMQFKEKDTGCYDRRDVRKPEERYVLWMICLADTFENFFKQNYYQMLLFGQIDSQKLFSRALESSRSLLT